MRYAHRPPTRTAASASLALLAWLWTAIALPAGPDAGAGAEAGLEQGIAAYRAGDYQEALERFTPLAAQGVPRAQTVLGIMHAFGEGTPQDRGEAARWYRRAAEQGYAPAQYNLGLLYLEGDPLPRSEREAIAWLKKAALGGHRPARRRLRQIDGYAYAEMLESERRRNASPADARRAAGPGARYRVSTLASLDLRPPPPKRLRAPSASGPEPTGPAPPPVVAAPAAASPPAGEDLGPYVVQLVATRTAAEASRTWETYRAAHPDLLDPLEASVTRVDLGAGKGTWYRLRAGPIASYAQAERLCGTLTERDIGCLAVRTHPR